MKIIYCGNSGIMQGIALSMLSCARRTREKCEFFILTMSYTEISEKYTAITEEQAAFLDGEMKKINPENSVRRLDIGDRFKKELSESPNLGHSYTPYTLIRLFCDEYFEDGKVLYLDADTVAFGDVSELYGTDVAGYELAAVKDYLGRVFIRYDYFNAGVILFNLDECRKTGLFKKSREFVLKKKTAFSDQDALNKCKESKKSVKLLDDRFNEQNKKKENTVIRHYSKTIRWLPFFHTLNIKPWQTDNMKKYYPGEIDPELYREHGEMMKRFERK